MGSEKHQTGGDDREGIERTPPKPGQQTNSPGPPPPGPPPPPKE